MSRFARFVAILTRPRRVVETPTGGFNNTGFGENALSPTTTGMASVLTFRDRPLQRCRSRLRSPSG